MPAKKPLKTTDARRETGPKEIRQPRKPKQVQSKVPSYGKQIQSGRGSEFTEDTHSQPLFNDRRKS